MIEVEHRVGARGFTQRRERAIMSKPVPGVPAAAATPVVSPEMYAEMQLLALDIDTKLRPLGDALREETRRLQQEKEHLNAAWAALTQATSDKKAEAARLDSEQGEQASYFYAQLKVLKQQVRDLLTRNAAGQVNVRLQALSGSRLAMEGYAASERELKADRRDLSVVLKELETGHEELVRVLRAENDKGAATLRYQFEAQAKELATVYEDKMLRCRDEMNAAQEAEVASIEKRKATQITALLTSHEQAFTDMKTYFNEITHSNLDLIKVRPHLPRSPACARRPLSLPSPTRTRTRTHARTNRAVSQGGGGRLEEKGAGG